MDIDDICDYCEDEQCAYCWFGNPCLGCEDYQNGNCISMGACADVEGGDSNEDN